MSAAKELHPTLAADERERLFRAGIALFNEAHFFAAHEAWEEIWRSTDPEPRDLFQGLIQVAVGFHHYRDRHRPGPAARLLARGRARLAPLARLESAAHGVDLARLLAEVQIWEAWLAAPIGDPPPLPLLHSL